MNELLLLFDDAITSNAIPINQLKIDISNGIKSIPIYALSDITDNTLRIYVNGQIGCFELVDSTNANASEVRIYKDGVIKCLSI